MADTINESLSKISAELQDSNKRYGQAVESARSILPIQAANSAIFGSIGGSIKDNLKQSGAGFSSFIDQLESLPVFGAISKVGKTLGGKFFSKMRQKKQDKLLAQQLGITKEEVAIRRQEQELIFAEKEKNAQLEAAAVALGYTTEQFQQLTNAEANGDMTAAEVEKSREDRRANESLVSAVEGVSDNLENLEVGQDGESKSMFSGILSSIKGFIPAIIPALTGLGATIMGGLSLLGLKIMMSARSGLARMGSLFKRIPGVTQLGKVFSKSLGGLKGAAGGVTKAVSAAPKAVAGVAKAGGKLALRGVATAAKFIPGVGLAVTAAMGIFDGMSAGIEEYKKSGKIGAAVKEGFAGAVSGLTFGLISQETISNGLTSVGDFAKGAWDGYTGLVSSAVDGVGSVLNSAVSGFNNLTGLNVPTNLTELRDSVASTFDEVGAGFTNLTGIEVPTFDDLSAKVSAFADNMKENIAKGWEGITNMASNAWSGVKGFFGFGGDDNTEEKNLKQEKIEKIKDQKLANDMEMEEISQRMDKFEKGKNAYLGRDTKKKYNKDEARFNELMVENESLGNDLATSSATYPTEMQFGYVSNGAEKVFYNYTPTGEIVVAKNQQKASEEYGAIKTPILTQTDTPRTITQTSMLQKSNSVAAQIAREYMAKDSATTTVVNAPNNSTTVSSGGGGQTILPVTMSDGSSASQAASANY